MTSPFRRLPPELFQFLIFFVPIRPRLLVLSLVSKQWLHLVRASITRLPFREVPSDIAALFPSLTHLDAPVWLPLPLHITAVTLYGNPDVGGVTHLSDLTLKRVYRRSAIDLLAANAHSLTRLWLGSAQCDTDAMDMIALLGDTEFPRLRDLTVRVEGAPRSLLLRCLDRHVTQLTSLSITYAQEWQSLELAAGPPLPLLRHLAAPYFFVSALLLRAPSLTSVACAVPVGWAFPRLSRLARLAVSLGCRLTNKADFAVMCNSLTRLPHLQRLRFDGPSIIKESNDIDAQALNSLTTLRALYYESSGDITMRELRLPYLVSVTSTLSCDPVYDPFGTLTALVANNPTLRHIMCRFSVATLSMLERQIEALLEFLRFADARGVETVFLSTSTRIQMRLPLVRQLRWMRVSFIFDESDSLTDLTQDAFLEP